MRFYTILPFFGLVFAGKIVNLPKLDFNIYSDQYTGYLNVSETHRLFYWFFESQNTPLNDPLIFWFNGGPGCSSLFGMLEENGPFLFSTGNDTFRRNEYTWNRMANVVYLESPVGVGFSYSTDDDIRTNASFTADENYEAVKEFLKEFPQFRNHDIFITGESYAGIFIPMLADRIIDGQKRYPINLKGLAIGNGYFASKTRTLTLLSWSYYHGLIGKELYDSFVEECCNGNLNNCKVDKTKEMCVYIDEYLFANFTDIDIYDTSRRCSNKIKPGQSNIETCEYDESKIRNYFNTPEVRDALHIPTDVEHWEMCNSRGYMRTEEDMTDYVKKIVKNGIRILLFYGDQDSTCDFLLGQQFAADLKLKKLAPKSPWLFRNSVAGYKTTYEGLVFLTVRGAGHMVPMTHPQQSFDMLQKFLSNKSI